MSDSVKKLRRDLDALRSEVTRLQAQLDGELTPEAKRSLEASRRIPRFKYLPHKDVLAEIS